jgi:Cu/Ag efflux protein CusF
MRMLTLAAAAAAALLAGMSVAGAAEVTGVIKSIDTAKSEVTLDNGKTYKLSASIKPADWKAGDKVKVTYDEANGQMTATALTKESS